MKLIILLFIATFATFAQKGKGNLPASKTETTILASEQLYRARTARNPTIGNGQAGKDILNATYNSPLVAATVSKQKPLNDGLENYRIL